MGHPAPAGQRTPQMYGPDEEPALGHFGKTTIIPFTARNKACFQRHKHISVKRFFKQYGIAEETEIREIQRRIQLQR